MRASRFATTPSLPTSRRALATQLKLLCLSGILDSLDARNRHVIDGKLAYTEFARREKRWDLFGTSWT